MHIIITKRDFTKLKPATRADIIATLIAQVSANTPNQTEDYYWENRVDLTPEQIAEFVEACAPETIEGLKVIAEEGPVIPADKLQKAGIENYGHFQGRTTKRARTVTGNKDAYLLAWDDWGSEENQQYGCGHYAVTTETYWSLRAHFGFG